MKPSAATCPDLNTLAAFVDGEAPTVAEHLHSCRTCTQRVAAVRQLVSADVDPETLDAASEEISSLVDELLSVEPVAARLHAARAEQYATPAVAARFSELATAEWDRDLAGALDHIQLATFIASRVSRRYGRLGEVEFEAWKNRSTIHRMRGEPDAARASLRRAERAIDRCADRELKRAIIEYADACICADRDVWQPEQALALIESCERTFKRLDERRAVDAAALRGVVHLRSGDYHEAHRAFVAVLDWTDPEDAARHADALRNLASTGRGLGRLDEAEESLDKARRVDDRLNRRWHRITDDAICALLLRDRGQFDESAELLGRAQLSFAAVGDPDSMLVAGTERAVSLVAAERLRDASSVLRELLAWLAASKTERRISTAEALAYLRELGDRQELTLDVASAVGEYVVRINEQRVTRFIPPIPIITM